MLLKLFILALVLSHSHFAFSHHPPSYSNEPPLERENGGGGPATKENQPSNATNRHEHRKHAANVSPMQPAFAYEAAPPTHAETTPALDKVTGYPGPTPTDRDGESSKKIIGSSVVTSVSVILNGNKPEFTDALGHKVPKPQPSLQVASPINLLNPDRYEFYTFDDNGELVKRLMTMQEIQSIVANGDGEGPSIIHTAPISERDPEKNVQDIVNSVQHVLNKEVESTKNASSDSLPVLDTPDVSSSWSMILPAIFGNSGGDIFPQHKPQQIVMTPDSDLMETSTKVPPSKATKKPKPSKRKPGQKRKPTRAPTTTQMTPQVVQEELAPNESVYTGMQQYQNIATNMQSFDGFSLMHMEPIYHKIPALLQDELLETTTRRVFMNNQEMIQTTSDIKPASTTERIELSADNAKKPPGVGNKHTPPHRNKLPNQGGTRRPQVTHINQKIKKRPTSTTAAPPTASSTTQISSTITTLKPHTTIAPHTTAAPNVTTTATPVVQTTQKKKKKKPTRTPGYGSTVGIQSSHWSTTNSHGSHTSTTVGGTPDSNTAGQHISTTGSQGHQDSTTAGHISQTSTTVSQSSHGPSSTVVVGSVTASHGTQGSTVSQESHVSSTATQGTHSRPHSNGNKRKPTNRPAGRPPGRPAGRPSGRPSGRPTTHQRPRPTQGAAAIHTTHIHEQTQSRPTQAAAAIHTTHHHEQATTTTTTTRPTQAAAAIHTTHHHVQTSPRPTPAAAAIHTTQHHEQSHTTSHKTADGPSYQETTQQYQQTMQHKQRPRPHKPHPPSKTTTTTTTTTTTPIPVTSSTQMNTPDPHELPMIIQNFPGLGPLYGIPTTLGQSEDIRTPIVTSPINTPTSTKRPVFAGNSGYPIPSYDIKTQESLPTTDAQELQLKKDSPPTLSLTQQDQKIEAPQQPAGQDNADLHAMSSYEQIMQSLKQEEKKQPTENEIMEKPTRQDEAVETQETALDHTKKVPLINTTISPLMAHFGGSTLATMLADLVDDADITSRPQSTDPNESGSTEDTKVSSEEESSSVVIITARPQYTVTTRKPESLTTSVPFTTDADETTELVGFTETLETTADKQKHSTEKPEEKEQAHVVKHEPLYADLQEPIVTQLYTSTAAPTQPTFMYSESNDDAKTEQITEHSETITPTSEEELTTYPMQALGRLPVNMPQKVESLIADKPATTELPPSVADLKPHLNMEVLKPNEQISMSDFQTQAATVASTLVDGSNTFGAEVFMSSNETKDEIEFLMSDVMKQVTAQHHLYKPGNEDTNRLTNFAHLNSTFLMKPTSSPVQPAVSSTGAYVTVAMENESAYTQKIADNYKATMYTEKPTERMEMSTTIPSKEELIKTEEEYLSIIKQEEAEKSTTETPDEVESTTYKLPSLSEIYAQQMQEEDIMQAYFERERLRTSTTTPISTVSFTDDLEEETTNESIKQDISTTKSEEKYEDAEKSTEPSVEKLSDDHQSAESNYATMINAYESETENMEAQPTEAPLDLIKEESTEKDETEASNYVTMINTNTDIMEKDDKEDPMDTTSNTEKDSTDGAYTGSSLMTNNYAEIHSTEQSQEHSDTVHKTGQESSEHKIEHDEPEYQIEQESTKPEMKPENTKPEIEPENSKPEIEPENSKPEIEPENTKPEIEQENTEPEIEQENTKPEIEQENTKPEIEQENTKQEIEQENTKPEMEQENTKPEIEEENTKYDVEQENIKLDTTKENTKQDTEQENITLENEQGPTDHTPEQSLMHKTEHKTTQESTIHGTEHKTEQANTSTKPQEESTESYQSSVEKLAAQLAAQPGAQYDVNTNEEPAEETQNESVQVTENIDSSAQKYTPSSENPADTTLETNDSETEVSSEQVTELSESYAAPMLQLTNSYGAEEANSDELVAMISEEDEDAPPGAEAAGEVEDPYIKLGEHGAKPTGEVKVEANEPRPSQAPPQVLMPQMNYGQETDEEDEDDQTGYQKPLSISTTARTTTTTTTASSTTTSKPTTSKPTITTTKRLHTLKPVSYYKQPTLSNYHTHVEPPKVITYTNNAQNRPQRPAGLSNLMASSTVATRPPVKMEPSPTTAKGLEASLANLDEDVLHFARLCNELAFSYWKSITSERISSARSLVMSPFALTSMLSMVFLGARGSTSGEMNEILKLDDMISFNPHLVFRNITDSVEKSTDSDIATVAFVREIFSDRSNGKILQFFKEKTQQFYAGHVEEVNFHVVNDIIRRRTNLLIKRHTMGKVLEYLRTNSVWVNGPLATISANLFQTDCRRGSMQDRDGEMFFQVHPSVRQRRILPIPAVLYKSGFTAGYEPNLDATVVAFGRIQDTVSTIYVMPGHQAEISPADSLERLEKELVEQAFSKNGWSNILTSLMDRPGMEVQLPRFSHRSFVNASLGLQKMGLKGLFKSDFADLRGLTGSSNHDIYLSDMIQINTFSTCGEDKISDHHHVEMYPAPPLRKRNKDMDATEDGEFDSSEAIIDFGSLVQDSALGRGFEDDDLLDPKYLEMPLPLRPRQARVPDSPRLRFDKPFLYFVRHNPTGMILFMGRFNPRLLP